MEVFHVIVLMILFPMSLTLKIRGEVEDSQENWIHVNMTLTAYYPDEYSDDGGGMLDMEGHLLRTLQEFLDGRAPYVTVSIDPSMNVPYGTAVSIPNLDERFGTKIPFEVRDNSSQIIGANFSRLEICVRSEQDSYDLAVNREATVYFNLPPNN